MRKAKKRPLLLYSTNTWLAYTIAKNYYGDEHYVWCTPFFDPSSVASIDYTVPPSSSPAEIYRGLHEDVKRSDRHSSKIEANKAGILRGAELKRSAGIIGDAKAAEIVSIINEAEPMDFRPLIFIIPYHLVQSMLIDVPVNKRAHPLSVEFYIERLPRGCFDVISLDGRY